MEEIKKNKKEDFSANGNSSTNGNRNEVRNAELEYEKKLAKNLNHPSE